MVMKIKKEMKIKSEAEWQKNIKKLYNSKPKKESEWLTLDPFRNVRITSIIGFETLDQICCKNGAYQTIYCINLVLKDNEDVILSTPWFFMSEQERNEKFDWLKKKLHKK